MLQHLEVKNIALIDSLCLELGQGLHILTGETGAGKSILIDSINAILGERTSREWIRTGTEKAAVEAVFKLHNQELNEKLEEYGIAIEEDDTLLISREFTTSGKNTCRINGKMVTVSMLKEIGQYLVDIHGQHDNQSLLRTESHIGLLDAFAGERIHSMIDCYRELLREYREVRSKLRSLTGDPGERERRVDLLTFQIDEIKKAKLKIGEEEELNSQRMMFANAEKIVSSLNNAYEALFSGSRGENSASDLIGKALAQLSGLEKYNEKYAGLARCLEDVTYQLDDAIEEIRKQKDGIEYDPDLLEKIEERIDIIHKLRRKYGSSIQDILKYGKQLETELDEINQSEEIVAQLQQRLIELDKRLYDIALEIHGERQNCAEILSTRVCEQLQDLEMKRAVFQVAIIFDGDASIGGERKYGMDGLDHVEFLISPNAGEPLKPLAKIASGGEMSRIMLAIKTILADVDHMPTLIFDEIDIGISGRAAQKVAEKLSLLSASHQVLCVTHLAQIACMADHHYLIEKRMEEQSTWTEVIPLDERARKNEIARIIGGVNITDLTLQHAQEMLFNAKSYKQ